MVSRRNIIKGGIFAFLVLVFSLFLVACSEEAPLQNSTAIANLPRLNLANCVSSEGLTGEGVANPNKTVPVPVGYRIFVSNVYPYALSHPDSWTIRENQVAGNLKSDLIVAEYKDNSRAFAFVLSEKLENSTTDSKTYYDAKYKELTANQKTLTVEQQGQRLVSGVTAYVISYNASQPTQTQSIQVTFASQGRGWVISYSASPDLGQKYCGQFARILDTFTLTGS
jgi:hypothetical protein